MTHLQVNQALKHRVVRGFVRVPRRQEDLALEDESESLCTAGFLIYHVAHEAA
jgi:hypothetical protein